MLKSLQKHWQISLAVVVIVVILLLWIPVLWRSDFQFDRVKFATEYYKVLIDIGKILLAFWLANIFLKRVRRNEFLEHYEEQWRHEGKVLLDAVRGLSTVETESEKATVDEWEKSIITSSTRLDYLAEVTSQVLSEYNLGLFGSSVYEYKYTIRPHVEQILDAFQAGEVLPLRPLSDTAKQSIDALTEHLGNLLEASD